MRQRLLDGGGRRDTVQGSAEAQTELRDYCSGKGVLNIVAQVCVQISGPVDSALCFRCNCDPTGSLSVLARIKVGGLLFSVSRIWQRGTYDEQAIRGATLLHR